MERTGSALSLLRETWRLKDSKCTDNSCGFSLRAFTCGKERGEGDLRCFLERKVFK